jgi:hypothetical protein
MSPHLGREPAVTSRTKPTGPVISFPSCAAWSCDDDEDWTESVGPDDEDYAAVRREHDIAYYHEPRTEWRERLQQERDRLAGGDPLWWGKPKA